MLTAEVLSTPLARAISTLQSGQATPAERAAAGTVIDFATDSCIRTICRSWASNKFLMRSIDLNDVAQECRVLILTKVMKGFRIPEDAEDSDSIARALHRYARRILTNFWIDSVRSIARDPTKRPSCGSGGEGGEGHTGNSGNSGENTGTMMAKCVEPTMDDAVLEGELLGAMKGALSEENYNILYLRYQGFTTAEIGKVVGLTRKAVNERIRFRIKPILAPRLRRQGFEVP